MPAPEAIRRILVTSAWFGGLIALAAWVLLGWRWALGFTGGALIGAGNLYFLTVLARIVIVPGRKNLPSILAVVTIKILTIYGGLAGLLLWHLPPTLAVVCGFSLVLAVITLKAAGRALLSHGGFKGGAGPRGIGERAS
jgi:hypothetical protein